MQTTQSDHQTQSHHPTQTQTQTHAHAQTYVDSTVAHTTNHHAAFTNIPAIACEDNYQGCCSVQCYMEYTKSSNPPQIIHGDHVKKSPKWIEFVDSNAANSTDEFDGVGYSNSDINTVSSGSGFVAPTAVYKSPDQYNYRNRYRARLPPIQRQVPTHG
jgi:hypothetical protein